MADQEFTPGELETEEWRDIPNRPNYQVSNLGRIRSVFVRVLKPSPRSSFSDYTSVTIRGKRDTVHALVASAFHGERPKGHFVNHKDGCKTNNRPDNLEYVSPRENSLHAIRLGLAPSGERMGTAKLTEAQAKEIIQRLADGELPKHIAKDYPVSDVVVGLIRQGYAWKHLPRPQSVSKPTEHWSKTHPQFLARGDNNGSRKRYDHIPKGEDSHNAKITEQDVRSIREFHTQSRFSMRELADMFGISLSQTKRIIDRTTWKQVD